MQTTPDALSLVCLSFTPRLHSPSACFFGCERERSLPLCRCGAPSFNTTFACDACVSCRALFGRSAHKNDTGIELASVGDALDHHAEWVCWPSTSLCRTQMLARSVAPATPRIPLACSYFCALAHLVVSAHHIHVKMDITEKLAAWRAKYCWRATYPV
jgi:hypothetical protein